jgi:hypothetical protein
MRCAPAYALLPKCPAETEGGVEPGEAGRGVG